MPIAVKKRRGGGEQRSPTTPGLGVVPCSVFPGDAGARSTGGGGSMSNNAAAVFFPSSASLDGYSASVPTSHYELDVSPRSCESATSFQCFNTRSPPILNLSPNLSPASRRDGLTNTPVFELRPEASTSVQDVSRPIIHSPCIYIGEERTITRLDGPSRKKRRLSEDDVIDLTLSSSPVTLVSHVELIGESGGSSGGSTSSRGSTSGRVKRRRQEPEPAHADDQPTTSRARSPRLRNGSSRPPAVVQPSVQSSAPPSQEPVHEVRRFQGAGLPISVIRDQPMGAAYFTAMMQDRGQYLLDQYPAGTVAGGVVGGASHFTPAGLYPGGMYPVCSLKIPGYNVLHMPATYLTDGASMAHHRGANRDGGGREAVPPPSQYMIPYVEQMPEMYHRGGGQSSGQVVVRPEYDIRHVNGVASRMEQQDQRNSHAGAGNSRQISAPILEHNPSGSGIGRRNVEQPCPPHLTRQDNPTVLTQHVAAERSRLTRQRIDDHQSTDAMLARHRMMISGGTAQPARDPSALHLQETRHGAIMTTASQRHEITPRGDGIEHGQSRRRGVFVSSAHNPLDALQSLTQAQSVSRGVEGGVRGGGQAPVHMTRQMTDARNFALQTAVMRHELPERPISVGADMVPPPPYHGFIPQTAGEPRPLHNSTLAHVPMPELMGSRLASHRDMFHILPQPMHPPQQNVAHSQNSTYSGFLQHFLSLLGGSRTPVALSRNLRGVGVSEVENYEALLNLAERLGGPKPRGLTKGEFEQLVAYRYNSELRTSLSDQTSCVVCMSDFENRQLLRVLRCSHEFHAKCVDKWLKTNQTCPICRASALEGGSPKSDIE